MSGLLAVSAINGVDISVSPVATQAFANSLLAEYTVTGSAVTSIDFSGLDINTHKSYRIEIEWNNVSASSVFLNGFINGDTVQTNYYSQLFNITGTSVAGEKSNNARLAYPFSNEKVALTANISINQGYATTRSLVTRGIGSTVLLEIISMSKIATVTNITQLTFTSSGASAIGVGSKIRIYRGDV